MKYIASAVLAAALLAPAYGAVAAAPSNLALEKPVSASSSQNKNRDAEFAVDGNVGTRWSSDFSDGNWIIVDLESVYDISSVILHWEAAYPEQYNLEVSLDGSNWETVSAVTSSNGGVDSFAMTKSARYVRVESVKRATKWGISLWELEVYGVEPEPEPEPETESGTERTEGVNLALNQTMFASSSENSSRLPEQAVDGDMGSRWASEYGEDQWLAVDLGATYDLSSLILHWEVAYAEAYDVQVSEDANQWHTVRSITNSDGGEDIIELSATGRYVRIQSVQRATRWGISLWELDVYGDEPYVAPEPQLVSEGRPASASSTERDAYAPENAFDGSGSTRWASVYGDTAWLQVDLGESHQITGVTLDWETAYSSEYQIQTSYDGQSWTTVEHIVDGNGGTDELAVEGHGRYVRMNALARATSWGHSLWEMQVFGYPADSADSPSDGSDGSTDDGTGSETDTGTDTGSDDGSTDDGSTGEEEATEEETVDTTAPTAPDSLNDTAVGTSYVTLSWSESTDNEAVMSYEVYRDGARITELLAPDTRYTDTGLSAGTTYQYSVRAGDAAGNWSDHSTTLVVTTNREQVVGDGVVLEWTTPDQRENGSYLELSEIGGYEIRYQQGTDGEAESIVVNDAYATSHELNLEDGIYEFSIAVFDVNGLYSQFVPIDPVQ